MLLTLITLPAEFYPSWFTNSLAHGGLLLRGTIAIPPHLVAAHRFLCAGMCFRGMP